MKTTKYKSKIILLGMVLFVLVGTDRAHAQKDIFAVAISNNGIVSDSIISKDVAKSLIAISCVYSGKEKVKSWPIDRFEMLVIEGTDSLLIKNQGGVLSEPCKEKLRTIKSNARLTFQGIVSKTANDEYRPLVLLRFRVK